jgi:hypothetical protein
MRIEYRLTIGIALFFGIVDLIYWFTSKDDTGTACLLFSVCAFGLIGSFLFLQWKRRKGIPRPEDRDDAEMSDGAGEIGFFPAASIWPAGVGIGAVFLAIGLIYGVWYLFIGGVFVIGSLIGFMVEAEAREEGPDDPGFPAVGSAGAEPVARAETEEHSR